MAGDYKEFNNEELPAQLGALDFHQAPVKKELLQTMSEVIAEFREALSTSVHEFAGLLGVAAPTVYRWEDGKALPSIHHFLKMFEFFPTQGHVPDIERIFPLRSFPFLARFQEFEGIPTYCELTIGDTDPVRQFATLLQLLTDRQARVERIDDLSMGTGSVSARMVLDVPDGKALADIRAQIASLAETFWCRPMRHTMLELAVGRLQRQKDALTGGKGLKHQNQPSEDEVSETSLPSTRASRATAGQVLPDTQSLRSRRG